MKATFEKVFTNGEVRKLFTDKIEIVDEYLIYNFQNELDLDLFFADLSINDYTEGSFKIINSDKEELKIFYREDFDSIKYRINTHMFNNDEFNSILVGKVPEIFDNIKDVDKCVENLSNESLMKNFRNIYNSIKEYSIGRVTNKIKKKDYNN